jgi:hypothetical protein
MALTAKQIATIAGRLWPDDACTTFALLDGAGIPALPDMLRQAPGLEYECLYSGETEAGVAEVAPYIARLEAGSEFAGWVMNGWGQRRGIFAQVPRGVGLPVLRRHFRKLNMVYGPDASPLLFRYYDPRVMRMFLPACSPEEMRQMFGPVSSYVFEGAAAVDGVTMSAPDGELVQEQFSLA